MTARYIIMGVSGCGKTHIGTAFAHAIGAQFIDGDDLHPQTNIDKMRCGDALNDLDRAPWLDKIGQALAPKTVIACSALKRQYRDQIVMAAKAPVTFLFLRGKRETLIERLSNRPNHFMPPALLDSQLAILEPLAPDEKYLVADIENTHEHIVATFIAGLALNLG
jgi:gluconokinase